MYAEILQFGGTLVTIAGLVVVAPVEAGRALATIPHGLRRGREQVSELARRHLPFLRRAPRIIYGSGAANITSMASGRSRVIPPDSGTMSQRISHIRRMLADVHGELDGLRADQEAMRSALTARLEELSRDLAELRDELKRNQQEQTRINARGFPLAAAGALLAGTPSTWLLAETTGPSGAAISAPWPQWWVLAAVGAAVGFTAVRWLVQIRGELGKGWLEVFPKRTPPTQVSEISEVLSHRPETGSDHESGPPPRP